VIGGEAIKAKLGGVVPHPMLAITLKLYPKHFKKHQHHIPNKTTNPKEKPCTHSKTNDPNRNLQKINITKLQRAQTSYKNAPKAAHSQSRKQQERMIW